MNFVKKISKNIVMWLFNKIPPHYWKSGNTAEVDFLIQTIDGIVPVEVKAGDNT